MRHHRGFTLIELMIGATVSLVVIGLVSSVFLMQQRSLQMLDLSREASSAKRDAMLLMQETVGRAGYGIDPRYAFDFSFYNCGSTPCRDSFNNADELVLMARDPNYFWGATTSTVVQGCDDSGQANTYPCSGHAWHMTAFDATHVTVNARANDTFLKGQVLLMTCEKGQNPVMGQVKTLAKATAAGAMQIELETAVPGNPYKTNLGAGHPTCFDGLVGTSVFFVNRYRFHVAIINGDPWLMLDRGLDYNQNGNTPEAGDQADEIPIAHGVEDMQIAYLLKPNPAGGVGPDNNQDWIIGNNPTGATEEPNPGAPAPAQSAPDNDPSRYASTNPANIRAVRIRLSVRSLLKDLTIKLPNGGDPPPLLENRTDVTGITVGQYRRYQTSAVQSTLNLNSKDPFIF